MNLAYSVSKPVIKSLIHYCWWSYSRWKDTTRTDITETECECLEWISVTQHRAQLWYFVNIYKLWVPQNWGVSSQAMRYSRKILHPEAIYIANTKKNPHG